MANYGFKTSNESPLQHEMRKENATKWKPSPSSQWAREGVVLGGRRETKLHSPRRAPRSAPESPAPRAHGGPHRDGRCDAAGRSQEPVSPRGQFSAEEVLLRQDWGRPELCHLATVSQ